METGKIKLYNSDYKVLIENCNWDVATDLEDKRILPPKDELDNTLLYAQLEQFPCIEITEDDLIYGVFESGQKVFIAKARFAYQSVQDLKD